MCSTVAHAKGTKQAKEVEGEESEDVVDETERL